MTYQSFKEALVKELEAMKNAPDDPRYNPLTKYDVEYINRFTGKVIEGPRNVAPATLHIRCSSLDQLIACAPSIFGVGPSVQKIKASGGDEADVGKTVHEILAQYINTGELNICQADRDSDAGEEIEELASVGAAVWDALRAIAHSPRVERPVSARIGHIELDGSIDIASLLRGDADKPLLIDWKTGHKVRGHRWQMRGYAYCAWEVCAREVDEIMTAVVYLRTGEIEYERHSAAQLEAWGKDLLRNVASQTDQYHPGEHCKYCRYAHGCSARTAVLRSTLAEVFLGGETLKMTSGAAIQDKLRLVTQINEHSRLTPATGEAVAELNFKAKLLEQIAAECKDAVRNAVIEHGPIPMPNGMQLVAERRARKGVDAAKAIDPLRSIMSEQQIQSAMKLSLEKLVAACADGYMKGEKKKARGVVLDVLNSAKAITETSFITIQERAIPTKEAANGSDQEQAAGTGGNDGQGGISGASGV